jgi:hypothetical protein
VAVAKILIAVTLIGAVWLLLLLKLGVWGATRKPADGVLSYTFNSWTAYPVARHCFLAQFDPTEFEKGQAYTSYTYPFVFSMFLLVAPAHVFLNIPYSVAHNIIPYFYVICLTLLLVFSTKDHLLAILERKRLLLWFLAFLSIGIVITDPLLWVSLLVYSRDSFHVLAAASFCFLSTWVFYNKVPRTALLAVGIFLALWGPIYVPAWILAGLFFNRALILERKWIIQVVGVSGLAWLNLKLPVYICSWAGLVSTGSGFPYRSGLDGSTVYMTSIYQAIVSPVDPRHWPTAFYLVTALLLAGGFQYLFRKETDYRPLQQALFLLIPYATIVILFPQFTSIHPYTADLLLVIPATFLIAFWSLQKEFWERLSGQTYVAWFLIASFILMTNLLTVAQNLTR